MLISRSCSWCHEMNPATERYCRACQHEAHVCRMDCACPRCFRARRAAGVAPTTLADVIEAGGGPLRLFAAAPEVQAGVNSDPDATKFDAPRSEVKRTPIRADLAEVICLLVETLVAEFGFDLFLLIRVGDGLVAASNATDGYVLPVVAPDPPTAHD